MASNDVQTSAEIKSRITDDYRNCLSIYREQTEDSFYRGFLDFARMDQRIVVSGATEKESIVDVTDMREAITMTCPKSGKLGLMHNYQSSFYIPITGTPYEVRLPPVSNNQGYQTRRYVPGAVVASGTIGGDGTAVVEGLTPGKQYHIYFSPEIGKSDLDSLFSSYHSLINDNIHWLDRKWSKLQPVWDHWLGLNGQEKQDLLAEKVAGGMLTGATEIVEGIIKALKKAWDALKSLWNYLTDPESEAFNFNESMFNFDTAKISEMMQKSNEAISQGLAILEDEVFLYIFGAAFIAWAKMLPPPVLAELAGKALIEFLINVIFDFIIGIVLTGGMGLAVKYGGKALKAGADVATKVAQKIDNAVDQASVSVKFGLNFILEVISELLQKAREVASNHLKKSKTFYNAAKSKLESDLKGLQKFANDLSPNVNDFNGLELVPAGGNFQHLPAPNMADDATSFSKMFNQKTTIETSSGHKTNTDVSRSDNQQPIQCDGNTCTHGEPVSMCTGEELLEIVDTQLPGMMPFDFIRYYRSGAVEQEGVFGHGWAHSLEHQLAVDNDQVVWRDHEGRNNVFPIPTQTSPNIINPNAETGIFLGAEPTANERQQGIIAEFIVSQPDKPFYHFKLRKESDNEARLIGHLVALSDRHDNRLTLVYDKQGRVARLDTQHQSALLFTYHQVASQSVKYVKHRERLVKVEYQPAQTGRNLPTRQCVAQYFYNELGQLIVAQNANGDREHYGYRQDHLIKHREFAGGIKVDWQWLGQGKQAKVKACESTHPNLRGVYHWAAETGESGYTNVEGTGETFHHNEQAKLTKRVAPDGTYTEFEYDEKGQLISECDQDGIAKHYDYDQDGNLTAEVEKDGTVTRFEYLFGQLCKVERGHQRWLYDRNDKGDITQKTDPSGAVTRYEYTEYGQLKTVIDPDGGYHRFEWNACGELLKETLPTGDARRYRYDDRHRLILLQAENGAISEFEYDALDRVICVRQSGAGEQRYRYNVLGKVTHYTDQVGQTTEYEYDDKTALLKAQHNPDGTCLRYFHDEAKALINKVVNESGEAYHLAYDANGRITQEIDFAGRTTEYTLNNQGYMIAKREIGRADVMGDWPALDVSADRGGTLSACASRGESSQPANEIVTEFERDVMGRLTQKRLADGRVYNYQYNQLGHLLCVDDGERPLYFEYDEMGQLVAEHQAHATLRYAYDNQGRLSKMKLPDGNRLHYHYQVGSLLKGIDLNGDPLTRHEYKHGHEISRLQGQALSQYLYDEQGRLTQHQVSKSGIHAHNQLANRRRIQQRQYRYNAKGLLSEIDDSRKGKIWYDYDPLERLSAVRGAVEEHFEHDENGNVRGMYTPDETRLHQGHGRKTRDVKGNRLYVQGDRKLVYDAFGNLSKEYRGRGHRLETRYEYDCQQRLTRVHLPNGTIARYFYDPFGRRYKKQIAGKQTNKKETHYFWQGERLIAEEQVILDQSNTGTIKAGEKQNATESHLTQLAQKRETQYRSFIYELGTFKPLAQLEGQGQSAEVFYYQVDHLGTPQELTSVDGDLAWAGQYRAYGNLKRKVTHRVDTPLRFQGQYYDEETGLHYNRHRYYNPNTGRFLTPDPIKLAGGINNYQYVPNPINWVDPLGLASCPGEENAAQQDNQISETVDEGTNAPDVAKGLRPEAKYLKGKKHGVKWTEGPATAKKTGIPQGQWGSKADLDFAGEKASTLDPGEGDWFELPKGHSSVVHRTDGTTVPANRIWVRNNGSGTFHGYPAE